MPARRSRGANQPAPRYFPMFMDIAGRACVVVGGGRVAERKVRGLLRAGASVTVVSPSLTPALARMAEAGKIRLKHRRFKACDVSGAALVFAATDDPEVNRKAAKSARNVPVNVADSPELCTFIVPSVIRRGPLTIAISTSGASPAAARAIRLEIQKKYGPEFAKRLKALAAARRKIAETVADPAERAKRLKALGSARALKSLRRGR